MKRSIVIILLLSIVFSFASAEYFEKVKTYQVGPGSIYSYYEEHSHPWTIHVTEIDLQNPYIKLETVKAGDKIFAREGTNSMSARSDKPGHRVVSAINGDFYNTTTGEPINNQVSNGEFVRAYSYWHSAFVYNNEGLPGITYPNFSGTVISSADTNGQIFSHQLTTVNRDRNENFIVIYNNFMGASTGANQWGFEVLAHPISDWVVNDTVSAVIEARESYTGNMTIPAGKFVISGHGTGTEFLNEHCQIGDTVKIVQQLIGSLPGITQLIGGGPRMLQNGANISSESCLHEGWPITFSTARHPRTAVGYNADSTKAYFVVVDGRQEHSVGMSLPEMADFMKSIGATNAINLDGGGSSTFTVRSDVMNIPSDAWVRNISNALMCVSSAPDSDLSIVQIERDSIAVYKNNTFDVPMSGWDMYYNPKPISEGSGLEITFPNSLGSYYNGKFTVSDRDIDGCIYSDLNGIKDSMMVHVISIDSLTLYPTMAMTDTLKSLNFFVYGCQDGGTKELLSNEIFEYELLNENIGEINSEGIFTPIMTGESQLVIHYGDDTDTSYISVEKGEGEVVLDEVESLSEWTLNGTNLDSNLTTIQLVDRDTGLGSKALRIDYTTTDDGEIVLETISKRIYGIPSEFLIDAMSDGLNHRLYLVFEDANGNEYKFKAGGYFNNSEAFETKTISIAAIIPGDGDEYYPMYLKQIFINLKNGIQSGTLYFDRIRCTYPGWTAIEQENGDGIPLNFQLLQNYPNPFNPTTAISYQLSIISEVDLSVFDVNGKKVAILVNGTRPAGSYSVEFSADYLPTGVYFYRLQAGNWIDTKKMLIIK
jgi:hypothetical protein